LTDVLLLRWFNYLDTAPLPPLPAFDHLLGVASTTTHSLEAYQIEANLQRIES